MAYEKLNKKLSQIEAKKAIKNNTEMYYAVKKILKKEERKKSNKDCELINECIEILLSLQGYDIDEVDAMAQKHQNINIESEYSKAKHTFNKKPLFAIIIILLMICTAQFTCMAFDYNPILEMYNFIKASFGITTMTENDITYTYLDNTKLYKSIEELIEQENLDIAYPTKLDEEIKLKSIIKYIVDEYNQYFIIFSTNDLLWQIYEKHNVDINEFQAYEKLNINNLDIYYYKQNELNKIIFYYNDYEYQITFNNYEKLIDIIENLKFGGN